MHVFFFFFFFFFLFINRLLFRPNKKKHRILPNYRTVRLDFFFSKLLENLVVKCQTNKDKL